MDPASIVSLLAFGGTCSGVLVRAVYYMHRAPAEILSLNNEINDLNALLAELSHVGQTTAADASSRLSITTKECLVNIRATFDQLTDLAKDLYRQEQDGRHHFQRTQWLRKKPKVLQLKGDLASHRDTLRDLLRVRNGMTLDRIELRLVNMEDVFNANQSVSQTGDSTTLVATDRNVHTDSSSTVSLTAYTRPQCNLQCACSCHYSCRVNTPAALTAILGQIFVGYVGYPTPGSACDNAACATSEAYSVRLSYVFPCWFVHRSINLAIGAGFYGSPEISLKLRNRRDYTAEHSLFQLARQGRVDRMKDILSQKLYSPHDVSTRGGSTPFNWALQHAASSGSLEACRLLIAAGADLDVQNDYGTNDLMNATQMAFLSKDSSFAESIISMLGIADPSDLWEFPQLHKIVLKILPLDLREQLKKLSHYRHINLRDTNGKTALHWAAHRGDLDAVKTLLLAGADAQIIDMERRSALHYAIISGSSACVDLLLISGCNVHLIDSSGDGPMLMAAWASDNPDIIHSLASAGGNIMSRNRGMVTGLQSACCLNHVGNARAFLELGADVNAFDSNGDTPLFETIYYNNVETLDLILTQPFNRDHRNNPGWSILHVLALYGTVDALTRIIPHLHSIPATWVDDQDRTAIDALADRIDNDEAFKTEFHSFMSSLFNNDETSSIDSFESALEMMVSSGVL